MGVHRGENSLGRLSGGSSWAFIGWRSLGVHRAGTLGAFVGWAPWRFIGWGHLLTFIGWRSLGVYRVGTLLAFIGWELLGVGGGVRTPPPAPLGQSHAAGEAQRGGQRREHRDDDVDHKLPFLSVHNHSLLSFFVFSLFSLSFFFLLTSSSPPSLSSLLTSSSHPSLFSLLPSLIPSGNRLGRLGESARGVGRNPFGAPFLSPHPPPCPIRKSRWGIVWGTL